MNKHTGDLSPALQSEDVQSEDAQSEDVWPPAPLRPEARPLSLRVEGMELTRSGDSLTVVNKSIRHLLWVEGWFLFSPFLAPLIFFLMLYGTYRVHHVTLPGLLPYLIHSFGQIYAFYLIGFPLAAALFWCLFVFTLSLGVVKLDRRDGIVKAGGRRARPISAIEAVQVTQMSRPFWGIQHCVGLVWRGSASESAMQRAATQRAAKTDGLVIFRQQANAEKAAQVIADFITVPVQRKADWKRSARLEDVSVPK